MAATNPTLDAALPHFLRGQRWFGGKSRAVASASVVDGGTLPRTPATLAFIDIAYADGGRDLYFAPLAAGDEPRDAVSDGATCEALLGLVAGARELTTRHGVVRGVPTAAFGELASGPMPPRPLPATSSNSLVAFGDRLLFKLFRRLEPGVNPDFEVGRFLTERTAFRHTPRVAGALQYERADGAGPFTLGIVQELVANDGDGWAHALADLRHYYAGQDGDYPAAAAALGRRTAELHLALAADSSDPAFAPEPFTGADLDGLRADIAGQGRKARAALGATMIEPDALAKAADVVLAGASGLTAAVKTRVHGDYHLGQTLRRGGDYFVIDFEGEPARPVAERRAKFSPARDVAGMLRSYHYAAHAGLFAAGDPPHQRPLAERWYRAASEAFAAAYAAAGGAALAPQPLVDAYMLAKALYELVYESNNRPDWVRIPLGGLRALLGG